MTATVEKQDAALLWLLPNTKYRKDFILSAAWSMAVLWTYLISHSAHGRLHPCREIIQSNAKIEQRAIHSPPLISG